MRFKWMLASALAALVLGSVVGLHLFSMPDNSASEAQFHSTGVTQTASFDLPAAVDRVFPLFGPIGEAEWAEGWIIEPIYSPESSSAAGMVFATRQHGGKKLFWTVAELDAANHKIVYVTFLADDSVGRLEITCRSSSPSSTTVSVAHSFAGLSETGNHRVEQYTQEKHQAQLQAWQHAITYYLKTGKRMAHHG